VTEETKPTRMSFWMEVSPEEQKLLNYIRHDLQFGEATITARRGLPVFIKVATKDIKLD